MGVEYTEIRVTIRNKRTKELYEFSTKFAPLNPLLLSKDLKLVSMNVVHG